MAQTPRQRLQEVQQAIQIGAVLRGAEVHVVPERLEARGELVAPEVEADDAQAKAGEGAVALHHRALRPVVAKERDAALQRRLRNCSAFRFRSAHGREPPAPTAPPTFPSPRPW